MAKDELPFVRTDEKSSGNMFSRSKDAIMLRFAFAAFLLLGVAFAISVLFGLEHLTSYIIIGAIGIILFLAIASLFIYRK